MRRLLLVAALAAVLLVSAALPAGADPQQNPNNSATVLDLDCAPEGEDPVAMSFLVMFGSGSVAVFDPLDDNGRKYVIASVDGKIYAGDVPDEFRDPVDSYDKTWPERRGYHGDILVCERARVVYTLPHFGTFTEFFTVSVQSK